MKIMNPGWPDRAVNSPTCGTAGIQRAWKSRGMSPGPSSARPQWCSGAAQAGNYALVIAAPQRAESKPKTPPTTSDTEMTMSEFFMLNDSSTSGFKTSGVCSR